MKIETVVELRSLSNPIGIIWNVGCHKVFGVLAWEGKTPLLKITLEGKGAPRGNSDPSHPVFLATKPPLQPTIVGEYPGYGSITLEGCCQLNWNTTVNFATETFVCILSLQPTQIWAGTPREQFTDGVSTMTLTDTRLAGFFGTPGMRQHFLQGDKSKDIFDALDEPSCVWTYHKAGLESFALGDTKLNLIVGGSVRSGSSARTGYSAQSCTTITVSAEETSKFETLASIKSNLEQIFSIFSLEDFSFEFTEYSYFTKSTYLVWYIGEDRNQFEPPHASSDPCRFSRSWGI